MPIAHHRELVETIDRDLRGAADPERERGEGLKNIGLRARTQSA